MFQMLVEQSQTGAWPCNVGVVRQAEVGTEAEA